MTDLPSRSIPRMQPSGNEFQDFHTMLGVMGTVWGWAEDALSRSIERIFANTGPIRDQRQVPISMSKRIRFLRAALIDVKALEPVKELGGKLADNFRLLSVRRNNLTHGARWQAKEGGFEFLNSAAVARKGAGKGARVNIADAVLLVGRITELADESILFMVRVEEIFPNPP